MYQQLSQLTQLEVLDTKTSKHIYIRYNHPNPLQFTLQDGLAELSTLTRLRILRVPPVNYLRPPIRHPNVIKWTVNEARWALHHWVQLEKLECVETAGHKAHKLLARFLSK